MIKKKTAVHRFNEELMDVPYISQSPSVQFMFQAPKIPRSDNNPLLNNQPWYIGPEFKDVDPSRGLIPQKGRGK